jgi:hypothetical protein
LTGVIEYRRGKAVNGLQYRLRAVTQPLICAIKR